jgi:peroxin-14
MVIREELVASATQFLQDPSVSSSSVENRITFLRSKNLTQEEIDVALSRSSGSPAPPSGSPYAGAPSGPVQGYYQQPFPQHTWQPPQAPPRRDWRDWFIMATVVGGVSYGLYSLGKVRLSGSRECASIILTCAALRLPISRTPNA